MGEFTAQNAIQGPWDPAMKKVAIRRFLYIAAALLVMSFAGGAVVVMSGLTEGAIAWLLLVIAPLASAISSAVIAVTIALYAVIGRLLFKLAFPIFIGAVVGMVAFGWAVSLLFQYTDAVVAAHQASSPASTCCH